MKTFLTTFAALAFTSANFLLLQPSLAQSTLRFPPSRDQGQPRTIGAGTRLLEEPSFPHWTHSDDLRGIGSLSLPSGGQEETDQEPVGGSPIMQSPESSTPINKPVCFVENPLIAIAPKDTGNQAAITSLQNPELFFYLPTTTAITGRFILVNEAQDIIYQATYKLPDTTGLLRIRIPRSVVLEPQQNYHWEFGLDCFQWEQENAFIQGSINLTTPNLLLRRRLNQSFNPLERARFYAENGVWNETLIIAAEIRNEYPQAWQDLLDSVELGEFAEQPLIEPFMIN